MRTFVLIIFSVFIGWTGCKEKPKPVEKAKPIQKAKHIVVQDTTLNRPDTLVAFPERNKWLENGLSQDFREAGFFPDTTLVYSYNFADLNSDGHDEVIVYASGNGMCTGEGCAVFILQEAGRRAYQVKSVVMPADPPLMISEHKVNGWRDLIVSVTERDFSPSKRRISYKSPQEGYGYPAEVMRMPKLSKDISERGITILADSLHRMPHFFFVEKRPPKSDKKDSKSKK
jgi:hypothetical protein